MKIKTTRITLIFVICMQMFAYCFAQNAGNINYNNTNTGREIVNQTLDASITPNSFKEIFISVKGIYNAKATKQVAVFSLTQTGKNIEAITQLMDQRIQSIQQEVKKLNNTIEFVTDMISFVPLYEYDVEKKLFNKKTYNEIPKGFELKKNIHIGYTQGHLIDQLVAICANHEVYDLVRVDYLSSEFEQIQAKLRQKAKLEMNKIVQNYGTLMRTDLFSKKKVASEGFNITYPQERYYSFQAYSSTNLHHKKNATVHQEEKSTTLHYVPLYFKTHNFIINPEIIEPVIQMVYELQLRIDISEKPQKSSSYTKEYYIVTPEGDLKKVPFGNP